MEVALINKTILIRIKTLIKDAMSFVLIVIWLTVGKLYVGPKEIKKEKVQLNSANIRNRAENSHNVAAAMIPVYKPTKYQPQYPGVYLSCACCWWVVFFKVPSVHTVFFFLIIQLNVWESSVWPHQPVLYHLLLKLLFFLSLLIKKTKTYIYLKKIYYVSGGSLISKHSVLLMIFTHRFP